MAKNKKVKQQSNKEESLVVEGTVIQMPGGGFYNVHTELGTDVQATLSGKMKKCRIRVVVGDHVTLEVSPYDITKGRITYRGR